MNPARILALFGVALTPMAAFAAAPSGTPTRYELSKSTLEATRLQIAGRLAKARTRSQRRAIYAEGRRAVLRAIEHDLIPPWLGTRWSMGGRTDTPAQGTIACGTFVATVLRDAGFRNHRIRMGRLASEHIAMSFTPTVRRFRNRPAKEVAADVLAWGDGLYIVGLDYHAGFILVRDGKARFIHSTVLGPGAVVSEPLLGDNPFGDSAYRVTAKLFDDRMMRRWVMGKGFEAKDLRRGR